MKSRQIARICNQRLFAHMPGECLLLLTLEHSPTRIATSLTMSSETTLKQFEIYYPVV
jgi:hypothetical protein